MGNLTLKNDEYNLCPVWEAILDVYNEFRSICDRHSLRYYITDGTAIGAVRHNGFIPWDDDFDLSMPREDYEKFIEIAKDELPQHLKFVNWKNTPELTMMVGKIQDVRRDRIIAIEEQIGRMLPGGIYIDIFPIDGYPESRLEIFWVRLVTSILSSIIRFRCMSLKQQSRKGCIVWFLGACWSTLMPWMTHKRCMNICEGFLLRHPFETSRNTGRASLRITLLNRTPLAKTVWGEPIRHEFCGLQVPLPHGFDTYLRALYGDYMQPPPIEKRQPGHVYSWRCPWWLGPTRP